ncbi:hypothetical protein [Pseudonocardia sp. NPDC049154]|uniref:hypothetical protein n=1 Tax=Pseudonocardia sp. NPDC049154 TaxID=3155501 RepID=UPI0033EA799C
MPSTWISSTGRRRDAVAAVTDVIRDLIPFVQTAIKGIDELRDRAALKLRERSARRTARRQRGGWPAGGGKTARPSPASKTDAAGPTIRGSGGVATLGSLPG